MSAHESHAASTARELHQAFDRMFAAAPQDAAAAEDDLLAITIGGDPFAVRLTEIGGLYARRSITWLPSRVSELLGLVSLRGALLPVYDLHLLLGYSSAAVPNWLIVAGAHVVLAFEQFDTHLRVPRHAITLARGAPASERPVPVREIVDSAERVRPIIHVPTVLEAIAMLAGRHIKE